MMLQINLLNIQRQTLIFLVCLFFISNNLIGNSIDTFSKIDNRFVGLWKYNSGEVYIHFINKSGLVVFTDSDKSTTLAYTVLNSNYKNEVMTFITANGKEIYVYGFENFKFINNNKLEVTFVRSNKNERNKYTLSKQSSSHPVYANGGQFTWKKNQLKMPYSMKGTWASTNEVLSIYEDGLWLSFFPNSGSNYGGFLGYDSKSYYPLKMYYSAKTVTSYSIKWISSHQITVRDNKDGKKITYYRRSWTPGERVQLAPSAGRLLAKFLENVFLGDSPPSSESSFDKNMRDAKRAKQNAYEERRRNGGN